MHRRAGLRLLVQDLGMLTFLISVFVGSLVVVRSSADLRMENILMFLGLILAVVFASFKVMSLAVMCAGLEVLFFTGFKLYLNYSKSIEIGWAAYIWLFLPLLAVGSMALYVQTSLKVELENRELRQQVEDLVMIDPLTGLYNLRSLYNDLERQMAYSYRNALDFTLMFVKLRYEAELKKILSINQYNDLKQRLAVVLEDSIRLEDKIYAIDDKGSIALMLTCDSSGAAIIKQRIKNSLDSKAAFDAIADRSIRVEINIAYLQYSKEYGKLSAMEFVRKVESELQYDV